MCFTSSLGYIDRSSTLPLIHISDNNLVRIVTVSISQRFYYSYTSSKAPIMIGMLLESVTIARCILNAVSPQLHSILSLFHHHDFFRHEVQHLTRLDRLDRLDRPRCIFSCRPRGCPHVCLRQYKSCFCTRPGLYPWCPHACSQRFLSSCSKRPATRYSKRLLTRTNPLPHL